MYHCEIDYFDMWNICSNLNMVKNIQVWFHFKGFGAQSSNIKMFHKWIYDLQDMDVLNEEMVGFIVWEKKKWLCHTVMHPCEVH